MIIGPKEHKTSALQRYVICVALENFIKTETQRLKTAKLIKNIERIEDNIARSSDLLIEFKP